MIEQRELKLAECVRGVVVIKLDKIYGSHFAFDVESDGPAPGLFNMISFGISCVANPNKTFYRIVGPITQDGIPEARAVSGISYSEQVRIGVMPERAIEQAIDWLEETTIEEYGSDRRKSFWSDNPAYDWQFWNYYCALARQENPAGFSARRIGDLWAGYRLSPLETTSWKKLRRTAHTHNAGDDAKGNAEALSSILLKIKEKEQAEKVK